MHRPKLQDLIRSARSLRLDVVFLTDLAQRSELSVVYVEELCLVCRGRVGVLLRAHFAAAWERAGRRTLCIDETERMLGVVLPVAGRLTCFFANYTPAGAQVGEKRAYYAQVKSLHLQARDMQALQVWGGDWNGHITSGEAEGGFIGPFGVSKQATTPGGRILKEFLRGSDLAHVDSHQLCRSRGTWRHPVTGGYYEIDSFMVSRSDLHSVNRDLSTFAGVADHLGKWVSIQFGCPLLRAKRLKRRRYWRGVKARVSQPPPKLKVQDLRGPSAAAGAARAQFGHNVEDLLQSLQVTGPPNSQDRNTLDGVVEGWEEQESRVWHAYTDGSGERAVVQRGAVLTPASAGWGVQLFARGLKYDACGSVVTDPAHSMFRGAERCTNNVGEASAILMLLE